LYIDCDLGYDEDNLRNYIKYVVSALIKDVELREHLIKLDLCEDYEKRQINALIELRKPLNRNVWEYDIEFMNVNELTNPENDDEINHIIELYQKQNRGPFREIVVDNNIKVFNKDANEKERYVFIHIPHIEFFRNIVINKLNDNAEFNKLVNKYNGLILERFFEK